ncbi:hypothetical protein BDN72DRAFT_961774 [Pluteus cervinus]|uniref:Uncharacterized protein n=1 Tax=Pluteus cervinus TaxID=181527 RepID=A0ACD3AKF7_9AGAR|nr:hypothetical protein BDN72DRAFT_961774 [Pluteus cervinus]
MASKRSGLGISKSFRKMKVKIMDKLSSKPRAGVPSTSNNVERIEEVEDEPVTAGSQGTSLAGLAGTLSHKSSQSMYSQPSPVDEPQPLALDEATRSLLPITLQGRGPGLSDDTNSPQPLERPISPVPADLGHDPSDEDSSKPDEDETQLTAEDHGVALSPSDPATTGLEPAELCSPTQPQTPALNPQQDAQLGDQAQTPMSPLAINEELVVDDPNTTLPTTPVGEIKSGEVGAEPQAVIVEEPVSGLAAWTDTQPPPSSLSTQTRLSTSSSTDASSPSSDLGQEMILKLQELDDSPPKPKSPLFSGLHLSPITQNEPNDALPENSVILDSSSQSFRAPLSQQSPSTTTTPEVKQTETEVGPQQAHVTVGMGQIVQVNRVSLDPGPPFLFSSIPSSPPDIPGGYLVQSPKDATGNGIAVTQSVLWGLFEPTTKYLTPLMPLRLKDMPPDPMGKILLYLSLIISSALDQLFRVSCNLNARFGPLLKQYLIIVIGVLMFWKWMVFEYTLFRWALDSLEAHT